MTEAPDFDEFWPDIELLAARLRRDRTMTDLDVAQFLLLANNGHDAEALIWSATVAVKAA
jgi:hypothetical protein